MSNSEDIRGYKSKHGKRIRTEVKSAKHAHRTFGLPSVHLNSPSEFLKKKSRLLPEKHVAHVHYHRPEYQHKLPEWKPLKLSRKSDLDDLPKDSTIVGRINFRKENILKVKKSQPPEPVPRTVDSRFGDAQDLRTCGLMPIYVKKKYFGKKPPKPKKAPKVKQVRELKRKTDLKEAENIGSENERNISKLNQPPGRYVTEEERAELLHGMKKNWEEMMNQFQRLPFLIDTPPKVKRKLKLENNLKQLEKDIEFIERHPYIYVCDDEE
ncbi:enkurin [Leptopilina boulardi]|uniref:enkurin n=1 Tax=Leptopilina boulardi TaxID=63433 RepID=UPI0021F539BD|nr:enkurin [Leptopilina boulardi]